MTKYSTHQLDKDGELSKYIREHLPLLEYVKGRGWIGVDDFVAEIDQYITSQVSAQVTKARIDELLNLSDEVGLSTKKRSHYVRQVYLKRDYIPNRLDELTAALHKQSKESE